MAKANNRVKWIFLFRMMERMGFYNTFIQWIKACISIVSYSVNINGYPEGYVRPTRGIRKGDPLSPYLFVICSEGFSNLIK